MAEKTRTHSNTLEKIKVRMPKMYHVIMYNDDFTPMDFVVDVLMTVFNKSEQDAFTIMYAVHRGGKAVVGIYTYDIARTKAEICVKKARSLGYPFRVEAVPEGE